jgi:hypothetical protein
MESFKNNDTMLLKGRAGVPLESTGPDGRPNGFNFAPVYKGVRVKMRAIGIGLGGEQFLKGNHLKCTSDPAGDAVHGIIRDIDTGIEYEVRWRPHSCTDFWSGAEITEVRQKPIVPMADPSIDKALIEDARRYRVLKAILEKYRSGLNIFQPEEGPIELNFGFSIYGTDPIIMRGANLDSAIDFGPVKKTADVPE